MPVRTDDYQEDPCYVLAIAEDRTVPLLERVKFLAIFSGHLNEFFQVRVAALRDQLAAGLGKTSPDGLSPGEQLRAIRPVVEIRVGSLVGRFLEHSRIFAFGPSVPVGDPRLQARLQEVLDLNLSDDTLAWELTGDGTWHKVPPGKKLNAQNRLQEIALQRFRRPTELPVPYGH